MEPAATDEGRQPDQGIYQDTNRPPKLTINNLPDEVLLEIFDSFRQSVDPYDQRWKKEHSWLNLAHVCGKWHAVMFASVTRLDLGINVGPEKPGHIKTILSGSLPIFLDYRCIDYRCIDDREEGTAGDVLFPTGITGSALWRIRAVLKHHPNRVRHITFEGEWASFNKFFKMTNCAFPMLESLSLTFFSHIPDIPATFLRGPDLSSLHHLRHLTVKSITFASIFDFLLSATALTDLTLVIDTPFGPTPETSLLACLQVMPCLLSLDLTLLARPIPINSNTSLETSTSEDTDILCFPEEEVVIHSKLKGIYLAGDSMIVKAFVRWLRAPSLELLKFQSAGPDYTILL